MAWFALLLAATASPVAAPAPPPAAPERSTAQAQLRILSAERIALGSATTTRAASSDRRVTVRPDGSRIIEFY